LHLHRGTPYIYQGEELGMTNVPFSSIEDFRDIESLNYYSEALASGQDPTDVLAALRLRSRDNGRTPMHWDDSPHAGFTVSEPWMPVNPNYDVINAEAERADPDSVLQHYRKLIALRHDLPVVACGDFTMLLPQDPQIYAFTRRLEDVELLVMANFSHEIVDADLPNADDWAAAEELLTNYSQTGSEELLRLRPWEARVFRRTVNEATPRR
jgi:oligo-1,6-glucosidase